MFEPYDPERFKVMEVEPDCLNWMKRQLGSDERLRDVLFIYRALETWSFFLAEWIVYRNLFVPLMEIGPRLSDFNEVTADRFLREILSPMDPRDQIKAYQKAESDHASDKEDFDARRIENKSRMYRDYTDVRPAGDGSVFLPLGIQRG